jgi:hypothetical protein
VRNNIALIQRGVEYFATKVTNAMNAGAVGAIIYNNVTGSFSGNLTTAGNWIPAVSVSQADGASLLAQVNTPVTLTNSVTPSIIYQYLNGTSMATPHVAGAVAFAAMNFPTESAVQRVKRVINQTTAVAALSGKIRTGGRLNLLKMIDTDSNGLPDWWEKDNFGVIGVKSNLEADADGMTNLEEYLAGTNPRSAASKLAITQVASIPNGMSSSIRITFPSVTVQADQVLHPVSRFLTGECIEDVNHEIYGGPDSQMVFGESMGTYRICVLEENAGNHSMKRALGHARALNLFQRSKLGIPILCAANGLQPDGQNDNGWNQGMLFLNPSQVWLQPPGYVTQMVSRNYQPLCVSARVDGPESPLDVTATRSEDGATLVLQVLNASGDPVPARIVIAGFTPAGPTAEAVQLVGRPDDTNTAAEPSRIVPETKPDALRLRDGNADYTFPGGSFTILRFHGGAGAAQPSVSDRDFPGTSAE